MAEAPDVTTGTLWAFLGLAVLALVAMIAAVILKLSDGFQWLDEPPAVALLIVSATLTAGVARRLRRARTPR